MTWTNPSQTIANARDTLLQCATVTTLVLPALTLLQRQARCHYPRGDARSDTVPMFVFRRDRYTTKREMGIGYTSAGHVIAHLYVNDASVDDGTLEAWAEGICQDLVSLGFSGESDIQFATDAESGESVEPSGAQLAGATSGQPDEQGVSYRVISISWTWEG